MSYAVAPQHQPKRKDTYWDVVEIPEPLGEFTFTVDDAAVKEFAFTQDDYGDWYLKGDSPFGGRIAQASLLANHLLQAYLIKYQTNLHDENEEGGSWIDEAHIYELLEFHNPVKVGETVTMSGTYVDKYVRRGRGRVVMESQAHGEDGRLLLTHRGEEIMRIAPGDHEERPADASGRRVTGEVDPSLAAAARAALDLAPGTPIEPISKRPSRSQIAVYSTIYYLGTRQNIHTDMEVARRAGLEELVMQGQQSACYLAELLTRFFGAAWFTSGRLETRFVGPVLAGDQVEVGGVVVGRDGDDGDRLDVDVWIRNAEGSLVTVGTASAKVED